MSKQERRPITAAEWELLEQAAAPVLQKIREDRDRTEKHVRTMLEYLLDLEHLVDPELTVVRWREVCGIRSNLTPVEFRKTLGAPPKGYVVVRRLEIAQSLLRETSLKNWRISRLIGFQRYNGFARAFKRELRQTPHIFRLRQRLLAEIGDREI